MQIETSTIIQLCSTAAIFYLSTVLKFLNDTIKKLNDGLTFLHKKVDDHITNYEVHKSA